MKKIAMPVTADERIDDHFGHCEYYMVFTVNEQNQIVEFEKIDSPQGCGCKSNIAGVLSNMGVSIMLAGGIGSGAVNVLNMWGIDVVKGCSGNASDLVKTYLEGGIHDNGDTCQMHEHHHNEGENHSCSH